MFFISFDKALFFIKVYRYPEVPFNRHVLAFFETSDFKEVRILFFNSTILIPKLTLKRQGGQLAYTRLQKNQKLHSFNIAQTIFCEVSSAREWEKYIPGLAIKAVL